MAFAYLSQRRLLSISGEDSVSFLQGLISNDISKLQDGHLLYTALLTPQGKFLHDFFIARRQSEYLLDIDASRVADLQKRLMMYRLRSKVVIEPAAGALAVVALWNEAGLPAAPDGILVTPDPRYAPMGMRAIGDSALLAQWLGAKAEAGEGDYNAWRIHHAIPDGAQDMVADKSLLLEFGFEDLHGVDFKKGCYVGQEVTARSKFRAQLKKYLHQVRCSSGVLPPADTPIQAGGVTIGEMRSSSGGEGLALLRLEELKQALEQNIPLTAADTVITAALPEWFNLPQAA